MTADAVRRLLEEGVDRGFFAGGAALVAEGGNVLQECYAGDARVEPAEECRAAGPETLWDLAELTQPLAGAALALALQEARALSLDDSISRFGDVFKRTRFDGVTLRRLLSHTSGVPAWFPCYTRGEGRAAYRRALSEVDPAGPPGISVVPSGLGLLLLAEAVETAAEQRLDDLFRSRIAGPLGLAADLLFAPEGADRIRAAGGERDDATERRMVADRGLRYMGFRSGVVNGEVNDGNAYRRGGGVSLNAGLFGTARAVASAVQAWLACDSRLLAERTIAEALESSTPGQEEERGLGWQLAATKAWRGRGLAPQSFGHTGITGASAFADPVSRRVFVLLANRLHPDARQGDMDELRRRFHEAGARLG